MVSVRRPGPVVLLPAFVAGAVLLAAGAGLGLRHLLVEGSTRTTWIGFALLAGGLLVTAWAGVRLLGRVRRRWWLLVVPGLLLVLGLAGWTVGLGVMASIAPRPALGERTPADAGLDYRPVTFPAGDGIRLSGWWVPSRNGAGVVLLHGAGSTRTAVLDQAAVLARAGYGVLLLDARGHGESGGTGMDFGWWGESDLRGAVDAVLAQPDVTLDRVGLVGLSMGGEEAIGAAGLDDRVGAVVAEGATNRVFADKAYLEEYGWRGRVQQGVDWLTYGVAGLLTTAPEPDSLRASVSAAASRSDPPLFLLITGGRVADEGYAAARLRAAAPSLVEIWTVPEAGHIGGLRADPAEWETRVVGFLGGALGPEPAG